MKEIMEKIGKISFVSFDEIYDMKDYAREVYNTFDQDTKEVYKWYYYHQLCMMTNKKMVLKDDLWLYIVGKDNIKRELKKEYEKFNKKRAKIKETEQNQDIIEGQYSIFDVFDF